MWTLGKNQNFPSFKNAKSIGLNKFIASLKLAAPHCFSYTVNNSVKGCVSLYK